MKIAFCCDHGGFIAKEAVFAYLKNNGHEVVDFGTFSEESCDYPDYAYPTAEAVGKGELDAPTLQIYFAPKLLANTTIAI